MSHKFFMMLSFRFLRSIDFSKKLSKAKITTSVIPSNFPSPFEEKLQYNLKFDDSNTYKRKLSQQAKELAHNGNRVYVNNLSATTSVRDLRKFMESIGKVTRVHILLDKHGRSTGQANVLFSCREDTLKAIDTLNNSTLDNSKISMRLGVIRAKKKESADIFFNGEPHEIEKPADRFGYRVFITGLAMNTTEFDLLKQFSIIGEVLHCSLIYNKYGFQTGKAVVVFKREKDAISAVEELDSKEFNGSTLSLEVSNFYRKF